MIKQLCILVIMICNLGCQNIKESKFTEMSPKDIQFSFDIHSSKTFKGVYYIGSDKKFHYFIEDWKFGDEYFKISTSNIIINNNHKLGIKRVRITRHKKAGKVLLFSYKKINIYEMKERIK